MSPTPKQIGRRLTQLRTARGLSQYTLAEKAGISRNYLRGLEAGTSDPTIGMVTRLAKALKVSLTELIR
jgi:transcriptional regulator with XRE-family HTH domain